MLPLTDIVKIMEAIGAIQFLQILIPITLGFALTKRVMSIFRDDTYNPELTPQEVHEHNYEIASHAYEIADDDEEEPDEEEPDNVSIPRNEWEEIKTLLIGFLAKAYDKDKHTCQFCGGITTTRQCQWCGRMQE